MTLKLNIISMKLQCEDLFPSLEQSSCIKKPVFVYSGISTPATGKLSFTIYHYPTALMSIILYDLINYPSKNFSQKEHFVMCCFMMVPISQFHPVFLNSSPKLAIIIIPLAICKTSFFPSQ